MSEKTPSEPPTYHRHLTDSDIDGEINLVHEIAEIKDVDEMELTQLHSCIDHLVDHFFTEEFPAEAMTVLTFSYEGFRITLYQNGHAIFQKYK